MSGNARRGKRRVRSVHSIEERPVSALWPYAGNARTHSKRQIRQLMDSITRFGFTNPVLVGDDDTIVAGHGRVVAAERLGMTHVPTVRLSHLTEAERRAYVIADNKLALNAGWDQDLLAIELQGLIDLEFDIELTGFSLAEVTWCWIRRASARSRARMGRRMRSRPIQTSRSAAAATSGSWAGTGCFAAMQGRIQTMPHC